MPSWIQVRISPPDPEHPTSGLIRLDLDPFTLEEQVKVLRMLGRHEVLEVFDSTGHPLYPTSQQTTSTQTWSAFIEEAFQHHLLRRNRLEGQQWNSKREIETQKAEVEQLMGLQKHLLYEQADHLAEALQRDHEGLDAELHQKVRVLRKRIRTELLRRLRKRDHENRQWIEQHGSTALRQALLQLPRKKFFVDPEAEIEVGTHWVAAQEVLWESHEYNQYVTERIQLEHPHSLHCKSLEVSPEALPSPPTELVEFQARVAGKIVVFEEFPWYNFAPEDLQRFKGLKRSGPMIAVHVRHALGHVIYPFPELQWPL